MTAWIENGGAINFDRVEVLNFGTAGYGTCQELLIYESDVVRYAPDLVLVTFLPANDVRNNSFDLEILLSGRRNILPFFEIGEPGHLELQVHPFYENAIKVYTNSEQVSRLRQTYRGLRGRIRLIELGNRAILAILSLGSTRQGEEAVDSDDRQTEVDLSLYNSKSQSDSTLWREAWVLTAAILSRFANAAAANGAEFHVAVASGPLEVNQETRERVLRRRPHADYDWRLPNDLATAMLDKLGVTYTNLLPRIERAAEERGELMHFVRDGHYSSAGHQLVADELQPTIERYILAAEGSGGR